MEWLSGKAYIYLFCSYVFLCGHADISEDAWEDLKSVLDPQELELHNVGAR